MLIDNLTYIIPGILIGFIIGYFINIQIRRKLKKRVLKLEDEMLHWHERILDLEKEQTAWLGCGELKSKEVNAILISIKNIKLWTY